MPEGREQDETLEAFLYEGIHSPKREMQPGELKEVYDLAMAEVERRKQSKRRIDRMLQEALDAPAREITLDELDRIHDRVKAEIAVKHASRIRKE